jgi:hypothetical protein
MPFSLTIYRQFLSKTTSLPKICDYLESSTTLQGGKKGGPGDLFLITSAEGKLQLVGKGGRLEKPVEAHR